MPQYKISLWGYGGESSYIKFTRDCYTHWQNQKKYDGIRDSLLDYITEQHQTAPPIAAFLKGEKGKKQDWRDIESIAHHRGMIAGQGNITVKQVDAKVPIFDSVFVSDSNCIDNTYLEQEESIYMCQIYSHEKGTWFEHILETDSFERAQLSIKTVTYFNGDDIVEGVYYKGIKLDNQNQDISFLGTSANIWKSN